MLNVEDSGGTNLFTVDVEGDVALLKSLAWTSQSVMTCAATDCDSDSEPGLYFPTTAANQHSVIKIGGDVGNPSSNWGFTMGIYSSGPFLRSRASGFAMDLAGNGSLRAAADNANDLGSAATSWRSLYVDTSVIGAPTATLSLSSPATDATTSGTVGAITLQATVDITATDLVLDVQDSAAAHLFTVSEAGEAAVAGITTGYLATVGGGGEVWAQGTSGSQTGLYSDSVVSGAQTMPAFTFNVNNTPAAVSNVLFGIQYASNQSVPSANDYMWTILADGSMCMNGLAGAAYTGCTDKVSSSNAGAATMSITSGALDATTSSTVAAVTINTTTDIAAADLLLNVEDSSGNNRFTVTEAGTANAVAYTNVRSLLAGVFVGAITTATTNYGGDVLPAQAFTVTQVTMRTSAAGSGGTTNFIFRVTDGTNTCDCTMACNAVAGNKDLTCAGSAGAGCALPASASLTYSVQSIGDCTTGPTVVGNVQVRGTWQ